MKRSLSRLPLAGMLLVTSIADAAAQSSGGTLQPVQSTLTQLVSALTGPIATALATLAVIACGFFAWSGRLTWGIAGSVILTIATQNSTRNRCNLTGTPHQEPSPKLQRMADGTAIVARKRRCDRTRKRRVTPTSYYGNRVRGTWQIKLKSGGNE